MTSTASVLVGRTDDNLAELYAVGKVEHLLGEQLERDHQVVLRAPGFHAPRRASDKFLCRTEFIEIDVRHKLGLPAIGIDGLHGSFSHARTVAQAVAS